MTLHPLGSCGPRTRPSGPRAAAVLLACALAGGGAAGCEDEPPVSPDGLLFGEIGNVTVELEVPLAGSVGQMVQRLVWSSGDRWELTERITYGEGRDIGDEHAPPTVGTTGLSVRGSYAIWVDLVNVQPAAALFTDRREAAVDTTVAADCGAGGTRLRLTLEDEARERSVTWHRCVRGDLQVLSPSGSGPDPAASRVAQAAELVRNSTVRVQPSVYAGSVPFATLARGEHSRASLNVPRTIRSAGDWTQFWHEHTGNGDAPPAVDFTREIVLVAGAGSRPEAGDSLEIRWVRPATPGTAEQGTKVRMMWRRPGHFCSPGARTHVPFHIVVVPRIPQVQDPVTFVGPEIEEVPCA